MDATTATDTQPVRSYIALGSNLESPLQQVQRAFDEIAELPGTALLARSSFYRSEAVGPGPQPDYINAVVAIDTLLKPVELLQALQGIERNHQRLRRERWGPRTLDLDILLYGEQQINIDGLQIPHPRMLERNFVIFPLYELEPALLLPGGQSLRTVYESLTDGGLQRIEAQGLRDLC